MRVGDELYGPDADALAARHQLTGAHFSLQLFGDRASLYDTLADNVLLARWRIAGRYGDRLHLAFAASDIAWPIALGVAADQPLLRPLINRALQQIPVDTQHQMRDGWLTPLKASFLPPSAMSCARRCRRSLACLNWKKIAPAGNRKRLAATFTVTAIFSWRRRSAAGFPARWRCWRCSSPSVNPTRATPLACCALPRWQLSSTRSPCW